MIYTSDIKIEAIYYYFCKNPTHFISFNGYTDGFSKFYRITKEDDNYFLLAIDGDQKFKITYACYTTSGNNFEYRPYVEINIEVGYDIYDFRISEIIPEIDIEAYNKIDQYDNKKIYSKDACYRFKSNNLDLFISAEEEKLFFDGYKIRFGKDTQFDFDKQKQNVVLNTEIFNQTNFEVEKINYYKNASELANFMDQYVNGFYYRYFSKMDVKHKLEALYDIKDGYDSFCFIKLDDENNFSHCMKLIRKDDEYFFCYNDDDNYCISIKDIEIRRDHFIVTDKNDQKTKMTFIERFLTFNYSDLNRYIEL